MATYVLSLEKFHINECRASTDTDTVIGSLSIGSGNPQFLENNVGDVHQHETRALGMAFPAFQVNDDSNVRFGYLIVNDGATRGDANNWAQLKAGIRQQLSSGVLQVKFGTSRSGLVTVDGQYEPDELPPINNPGIIDNGVPHIEIDWSKVWEFLKPYLEKAADAFFKWLVGLFNPNCDGFVAGEIISVSGEALRASTYRNNPYQVTKRYPGYDSPNFCGVNSDYTVTYSFTRKDVTLDPATVNQPVDVLIVNKNSGKALDVPGSSTAAHAHIQQYELHGKPNQQMRLTPVPNHAGFFTISPRNSQLNFDVAGGALQAHTGIQQFDPHPDYPDQQWVFDAAGDGSYFIRSATTRDLVLDVPNASRDDQVQIQIYPRKQQGTDNQQWYLRPV